MREEEALQGLFFFLVLKITGSIKIRDKNMSFYERKSKKRQN